MNAEERAVFSKVPEATFVFWIIRILATTPGETGGDAVSIPMNLGYLVGTTLADFADRSLGIGYMGGTIILFAALMASLFIWNRTLGTVAVDSVSSPKSEVFHWVTIMSRRRRAPHSATSLRTADSRIQSDSDWAAAAARRSSAVPSRWSHGLPTGPGCPTPCCSGPRSF